MNKKESFIIQGLAGRKALSGTARINGAKNAALKAVAAAMLFDGPVRLENAPKTADIDTISKILTGMGGKVRWDGHVLSVDATTVSSTAIDPKLAGSMRASVVLTGPMLARFGRVAFPAPGGCVIGARPIDLFLSGYEQMGATVDLDEEKCIYNIKSAGLKAVEISFRMISVGATETLMMAAVLGNGQTVLNNCAMEPEIVSVAEWLNSCGADIKGVGTPTITITGTNGRLLKPQHPYVTIPDRIEAGSFLILGALCAENLTIENCRPSDIQAEIDLLQGSGVPIQVSGTTIKIAGNTEPNSSFTSAPEVRTKEYPGFATDLQPVMTVFLTQSTGNSHVIETIYEARFKYVDDLKKIGAKIEALNEHEITVKGPTPLRSVATDGDLHAHDIRAGFALVTAALCSEGTFRVNNINLVDRGYEKLEERLRALGAQIERRVE